MHALGREAPRVALRGSISGVALGHDRGGVPTGVLLRVRAEFGEPTEGDDLGGGAGAADAAEMGDAARGEQAGLEREEALAG